MFQVSVPVSTMHTTQPRESARYLICRCQKHGVSTLVPCGSHEIYEYIWSAEQNSTRSDLIQNIVVGR